MLARHALAHDGEIAAEVIAGHAAHNDAGIVPAVVFTDPEIATAGTAEHEAKEEGYDGGRQDARLLLWAERLPDGRHRWLLQGHPRRRGRPCSASPSADHTPPT